jgi:hypothetical protein
MRFSQVFAVGLVGWWLGGLGAASTQGAYTHIRQNLLDAYPDSSYAAGVFTIASAIGENLNNLQLYDGSSTPLGPISNTSVLLETSFARLDLFGDAVFEGGSYTLRFDCDGSTGQAYELSGTIVWLLLRIGSTGQHASAMTMEGLLQATTVNLPGSGIWPAANGLSEIAPSAVEVPEDLGTFDWETGSFGGGQAQYSLFPVPEPTTMTLWVFLVARVSLRSRTNPSYGR